MAVKRPSPAAERQILVPVEEESGIGEARRQAGALARRLALDATTAGHLALAVTEAAANLVRHAGRGTIALRALHAGEAVGVELLAIDKGPGIANVGESMRDGHSTGGSPGTGLGALLRMSDEFDLYSQAGGGTLVRCELWDRRRGARRPDEGFALGAVCAPMKGEPVSGDAWTAWSLPGREGVMVVDGLGHGADAAEAAHTAVEVAKRHPRLGAAELIAHIHDALRATRGAAGAVAVLDTAAGVCTFCGVGNISGSLHARGKSRSMVSHGGILGHQARKIAQFSYPLAPDTLCILHTDGLATRWSLEAYPGLAQRHPGLVAAALYRDFSRGRDDVAVLAVRAPRGAA
jgi:anti-sigma regulatory factor (Ser/Thr protein kinase)